MTAPQDPSYGYPDLSKQPYPQQGYPQQGQPPPYPQQGYPPPPGYAPPQGGYGGMPPMNPQQMQQAPAPEEINQSYRLWLVAIGLAVIGLIIAVIHVATFTVPASGSEFPDSSTVRAIGVGTAVVSLIVSLILYGVWYLFVHKMRDGRQWARITLLVIGILAFIRFLASLAARGALGAAGMGVGGGDIGSIIVGVLEWIAVIVAVIMMFRPNSNAYFRTPVAYA
jgi:hypothetical protein